ncbi:MAG: hypothetical protein R3E97_03365 [Candidatus Eisenbacteria bacterium]
MPIWSACFGLVLLACVVVSFTIWQSVLQLSSPDLRLDRVARHERPDEWDVAEQVAPWAVRKGFDFLGAFQLRMQSEPLAFAWRRGDSAEYLCQYQVGGQVQYDIVSLFAPRIGLTTASTKDSFALPQPPGACVQAFPGEDLEQLWERHALARLEFTRVFGEPSTAEESFESLVLGALRRQAEYVQSIPFWQLRGPWWFFVERDRKKNRLASEAYDLEWIAKNVGTDGVPSENGIVAPQSHRPASSADQPGSAGTSEHDVSEAAQRRHA